MKKFALLSSLLLFLVAIFSNCSTTDTTIAGPSIKFANSVSSYEIDFATQADPYTVSIVAGIDAISKIKDFTVTKKDGSGASSSITVTGSYSGETSFTETFNVACASTDVYPIQIIFNVTDKLSKGMEKIYTITKKTVTGFAFTKSGMFYHIAGLLQGAYDLDGDALVSTSGSASAKSLKNTDAAGNAFTGSWTSDAANGTQFVKANSYDYTNANAITAATTYALGSASATVTNPAVNDIYIAKKGTTFYAIKILTLDPAFSTGTGGNPGIITFGYKKN